MGWVGGRFTQRKRTLGTNWMGGYVALSACLDGVEKGFFVPPPKNRTTIKLNEPYEVALSMIHSKMNINLLSTGGQRISIECLHYQLC